MRVFSLIFIFYLLFLSWQPCQDLVEAASLFSTKTDSQMQTDSSEQSSEQTDDCSPLCICSCCQISSTGVYISFTINSQFIISHRKDSNFNYQNDYFQQHLDSIWQPPKFNFTA